MSVRVFAPAKVNLTLEVAQPRADGMHPLRSVVTFADCGDWIEASPAEALTLVIDGPLAAELEGGEANLVLRAARALADAAGIGAPGAALALTKNLPLASGLGGGSSDAAATLLALNEIWALGQNDGDLASIARGLGSDVAVCIGAAPAIMTGVGDVFETIAMPAMPAILVNPRKPLSTPDVYRRFDTMRLGRLIEEKPWAGFGDGAVHAAIGAIGNDLEAPARALLPELSDLSALLASDARILYAGLSGSGATMFALTENAAAAAESAAVLRSARPDWWIEPVRLGGVDRTSARG